jgi:hypothetical protein
LLWAAALAAAFAAVASPSAARAQGWSVGVDAGRIRSSLDPIARQTQSVAANLGYADAATAFRLSAGIPTSSDSVRWAAVAASKRFSATRSAFTGGIDLSGSAFAFQISRSVPGSAGGLLDPFGSPAPSSTATASGQAVSAQAMPLLAYETGSMELQARAGMSYYNAEARPETKNRAVKLGDVQLTLHSSPAFAVAVVMRHYVPRQEDAATFAGTSAAGALGRLRVVGNVGTWIGGVPDEGGGAAPTWSMGAELRLTNRASLEAAARHDSFDPLFRSAAQTSWSIGASMLLGRVRKPPVAPVPADYNNGAATIRVPAALLTSTPRVAGDFNGWKPESMERVGTSWSYRVLVAPGVYNYAFVAPDGTWYVPEGVPGRKDDGMGGQVAVLVVR